MIKEVLNKLPSNIRTNIEYYKRDYHSTIIGSNYRNVQVSRIAGYVKGLRDAGIISERERQILFAYMT